MNIVLSDKIILPYLPKKNINVSDEGEAIGIAAGYWLATKKRATVWISADGFCNALNPITSYVIPEKIKMNIIISYGRKEPQHIIMSEILVDLLRLIKYDPKRINIKIVK